MEKIKYILEKYKKIIIISLGILIILIILICLFSNNKESDLLENIEIKEEIDNLNNATENNEQKSEVKKVKVDIKGFVKKPGVYELSSEDRVSDAIKKAGDLSENANTEYLNLSRKLTDEMVIIVYSNDEISKFKETDKEVIYIEKECKCPDNENNACINEKDVVNTIKNNQTNSNTSNNSTNKTESTNSVISINTATLEELMTLNGIGESKAKLIIEYRESNGGFKSIDEIKNIKGIGDSVYSKIKEHIKL